MEIFTLHQGANRFFPNVQVPCSGQARCDRGNLRAENAESLHITRQRIHMGPRFSAQVPQGENGWLLNMKKRLNLDN